MLSRRLATKDDLDRLGARLDERFEQLEERLKHYVNVRVGAMIATATALMLTALAIATAMVVST